MFPDGLLETLLGIEGTAARVYFSHFSGLLKPGLEFAFDGRNRRPPRDPVNALLSFAYSLLLAEWTATLSTMGFDAYVGFLHQPVYGRPALSLDMMEEFRPFLADRLVLSMINRNQIHPEGFLTKESGAVYMDDATRRKIIETYQKRKQEELIHPFLNEKVEIGNLFFIQALLLARFIRGDMDGYPPFIWK